MIIMFYKSKYGDKVDTSINFMTGRLGYSHVEFLFSDGIAFSSSGRDKGTRYKRIKPNDHWDLIEINTADENKLRLWCDYQLGFNYNLLGALGLPSFFVPHSWYCSEIVLAGLHTQGILLDKKSYKSSPNNLYTNLQALLIPIIK